MFEFHGVCASICVCWPAPLLRYPFAKPLGIKTAAELLTHPQSGASWEGFALEQVLRISMHDLKLNALYVVYPGKHRYKLVDGIEAVPLWAMPPGEGAAH